MSLFASHGSSQGSCHESFHDSCAAPFTTPVIAPSSTPPASPTTTPVQPATSRLNFFAATVGLIKLFIVSVQLPGYAPLRAFHESIFPSRLLLEIRNNHSQRFYLFSERDVVRLPRIDPVFTNRICVIGYFRLPRGRPLSPFTGAPSSRGSRFLRCARLFSTRPISPSGNLTSHLISLAVLLFTLSVIRVHYRGESALFDFKDLFSFIRRLFYRNRKSVSTLYHLSQ